jgi:hypothetical protein
MRPYLAGVLAAAALAMGGCYESKTLLLDPAQAAAPLALGHQQTVGGKVKEPLDAALDPDRWYRIKDSDGKVMRVLFVPLGGRLAGERRYAFAEAESYGFVYGVAYRRGGRLYFDTPNCEGGPALALALRHGAQASGTGKLGSVCTFTDATSLIGALKDFAGRRNRAGDMTRLDAAKE